MDRTKCNLSDSELIEKVNNEVSKMCKTGGKSFTMRIPAKVNEDTDLLISEMATRFKELSVKVNRFDDLVRDVCEWKPITDTEWQPIGYTTDCTEHDTIRKIGMDYKYCPYCGKKTKRV